MDHFLPFYPLNNLKNQNFDKMKKTPGDTIILHKCTINDKHMIYGSWDMKHDRQNFFSFWTSFCTFTPLTTWKIKILKKWKKTPGDTIISHKFTINDNHIYGYWDMKRDWQNFLSFWTLSCIITPLTTRKSKFWKSEKKQLETSSFYTSAPKIMIICYTVP